MGLSGLELGMLLAVAANLLLVALVVGLIAWIWFQPDLRKDFVSSATEAETVAASNGVLLSDMLAEVSGQSMAPFNQALDQGFQLASSIEGVVDANYSAWKAQHQPEIDALIATRDDLEFKLQDLKSKLDRAHKVVTSLHAHKRQSDSREDKFTTLQVTVQHLKEELVHLQSHREQSLSEAAELRRQLKHNKQLVQEQLDSHGREIEEQNRLQALLREEAELLRVQLERERDILSRTLIEKDFIEGAFLETDAATDQLLQFKSDYEELQKAHRLLQLKTSHPST